ncbi:MAG: SLATT domain-containing protein [Hyphomicrobium sp.]
MASPAERLRPAAAAVSTIETELTRRLRNEHHAGLLRDGRDAAPDTRAADQLAATMRLVKAARFNAADRLARKQAASLFSQSMVALYFVGLSVWQAVYVNQIDEPMHRLITFLSIVSSVFTLMLGLLEALSDYQMKAHHLHNCALAVSELSQELAILRPTDPFVVQEFRRRYNEALKSCPVNHSRLDYLFARTDGSKDRLSWGVLWARYVFNVYGLYAVFLAVPPLLWVLHH